MKNYEIEKDTRPAGNPIDVIMGATISFLRGQMFDINRVKTEISRTDYSYLINRINEQYELLESMSKEEVEVCRKTSVLRKSGYDAVAMNNFFFALEQSFRNIYCETWPEFDPEIEKLLYKDSSDYYQRREIIQFTERMIDEYKEADKNHVPVYFETLEKFFNDCRNYLDKNAETNYFDKERFEKAKLFVEKYILYIEDIDLMESVVKHRKQEMTNEVFKMLVLMEKK